MENNNIEIFIKIKTCKICGLTNNETRFQDKRKTCIKCNSKRCNEMRGNEYFREVMRNRYVKRENPVGRPRKQPILIIENFEN